MMSSIAGPSLLTASKEALVWLQDARRNTLECNCELDADLRPLIETLDPSSALVIARLDETIGDLAAAIYVAEQAAGPRPHSWLPFFTLDLRRRPPAVPVVIVPKGIPHGQG